MIDDDRRADSDGTLQRPYGLTVRELEVLELACDGMPNLEIARRCAISEGVVKLHLHHAYAKLGVQGRMQAARLMDRVGGVQAARMQRMQGMEALLAELLPHMSHEVRCKGEIVFRKGEPGSALYYVQHGTIAFPELGAEVGPGSLFGEIAIFAPGRARTSSARCETDAHLFCLTAGQARQLCFDNPHFAYHVVGLIAERLWEERARKG